MGTWSNVILPLTVTDSGAGVTVAVSSAVPVFPEASIADAVQTTIVSAVTAGAVNVVPENLPPFVQLNVGVKIVPALSVTVRVAVAVLPPDAVKVDGLKVNVGAVVSGLIVTVRVALEEFPAASLADAVQTLVVTLVTIGAVNVDPVNAPPFVHVVVGVAARPILSVAVRLDTPALPPIIESEVGLKDMAGAVVSATGAGGGGGVTVPLEDEPPPPQATVPRANIASALTCMLLLIT